MFVVSDCANSRLLIRASTKRIVETFKTRVEKRTPGFEPSTLLVWNVQNPRYLPMYIHVSTHIFFFLILVFSRTIEN